MSSDETLDPDSSDTLEPEPWNFGDQSPDLFADSDDNQDTQEYKWATDSSSNMATLKRVRTKTHDISESDSESDIHEEHRKVSHNRISSTTKNKQTSSSLELKTDEPKGKERTLFLEDVVREDLKSHQHNRSLSGKLTSKQKIECSLVVNSSGAKHTSRKYDKQSSSSPSSSSSSNSPSLIRKPSSVKKTISSSSDIRLKESKSTSSSSSLKRKHSAESDLDVQLKEDKCAKKKVSDSSGPKKVLLNRSDTDIVEDDSGSTGSQKVCPYGKDCYRKNPSHLKEFSHKGDKSKASSSSNDRSSHENTAPPIKRPKLHDVPSTSGLSKNTLTSKTSPSASNNGTAKIKGSNGQSYSFFLTKVNGVSDKYNSEYAMDIKDILSPKMGELKASCQFNYMFEISWLVQQYPQQFRSKPLLLVHGEQGASKASLQADAMHYSHIKFCQAKLEMIYGTHHTKMMFLLYETGMRVVIHTSNLIERDWFQKTQGIWVSPLFPKLSTPGVDKGDSVTNFKRDLINYVSAYKAYQLKEWVEHLANHDMSSARVFIVGSVPGRHVGDKVMSSWGHLRLRRLLKEHGPPSDTVKSWPVIGQFSSVGSMGPTKDQWLCAEFLQSLSATKSGSGLQSNTRLELIFPSKDNVRLSLEGWPAGGSIPYSINTAKKQTYMHTFWHVWKSEGRGRSRAMPHIKTYTRPSPNGKHAAWFMVTSANLSKAAWGMLEKKGAQLMIRSYELGVLFIPKFFDCGESFGVTSSVEEARSSRKFLLPYDLPTTKYQDRDRPWVWDIPYMDLPDSHGNMWCPFSK